MLRGSYQNKQYSHLGCQLTHTSVMPGLSPTDGQTAAIKDFSAPSQHHHPLTEAMLDQPVDAIAAHLLKDMTDLRDMYANTPITKYTTTQRTISAITPRRNTCPPFRAKPLFCCSAVVQRVPTEHTQQQATIPSIIVVVPVVVLVVVVK
jgi:hypothetical protein